MDRGPWKSPGEVMSALVQREKTCLKAFFETPRDCQQGIYNGPDGYHPTKEGKLAVLQDFLKVVDFILPKRDSLNAGIIWHNDLIQTISSLTEPIPSR
ncbi:hypothetical protein VTN77DRAFT_5533 [Rasamsonia byssochlamydoides]|uniref:uncharacterized protein n=1 Tax=Rasamsonia byssochlamydoides TaxID=89139 RepID=UPI0037435B7F